MSFDYHIMIKYVSTLTLTHSPPVHFIQIDLDTSSNHKDLQTTIINPFKD